MYTNNTGGYIPLYRASFCGNFRGKQTMAPDDKKLDQAVSDNNLKFVEVIDKNIPDNGRFLPLYTDYEIPGTSNCARVGIVEDGHNPKTQRVITLGVRHSQKDRLISNYMYTGSKQDVINYLKDNKNNKEFKETIKRLSDKTDDYYSSL